MRFGRRIGLVDTYISLLRTVLEDRNCGRLVPVTRFNAAHALGSRAGENFGLTGLFDDFEVCLNGLHKR